MIKITKLEDEQWYLKKIYKILVHRNTKSENFHKALIKKLEEYSNLLAGLGISINDFSNAKGRTIFEEFIVADFQDLKRIKEKIDCTINNKLTTKFKTLYNRFSKENINKLIVDKFSISVCPYCNENYIINRGSQKAMAQLDHFFTKEKYPIFSICLYNLVPSCYACDHIKQANKLSVSPHDQEVDFNTVKITYKPKSTRWLYDHKEIQIVFKPIAEEGEKIMGDIQLLNLQGSYNYHTDYVQEILKKELVYNDSRLEELLIHFPDLFSSKEELLRLVFGNYISEIDLNKRPLSKLTKDILEELGVIEELI